MSDQLNMPHAAVVARKYLLLYLQFNISERYRKTTWWIISRNLVDVSEKILDTGLHPLFWSGFLTPVEVCDVCLKVEKQFCRAESCECELPQGSWGCKLCA